MGTIRSARQPRHFAVEGCAELFSDPLSHVVCSRLWILVGSGVLYFVGLPVWPQSGNEVVLHEAAHRIRFGAATSSPCNTVNV